MSNDIQFICHKGTKIPYKCAIDILFCKIIEGLKVQSCHIKGKIGVPASPSMKWS